MKARRPKNFDCRAWQVMTEYQRMAEAVRHSAITAAQRRYEGQRQRAEATYDRTMRRARKEREQALAAAQNWYRETEDNDPALSEGRSS